MSEDSIPYCKLCAGCGEDGCCSYINCVKSLALVATDCEYGESYLKDIRLDMAISRFAHEIFGKLKEGKVSADEAVIQFEKEYEEQYSKIFK